MPNQLPVNGSPGLPKRDADVTLEMALREFWGLASEAPARFNRHVIRDENKQSGTVKKHRTIFAPDDRAREIHRVVRLAIRLSGVSAPSAVGSVPGSSPLLGLRAHRIIGTGVAGPRRFPRYWYLTDLSGAYGSVPLDRMAEALCALVPGLGWNRPAVEEILRRHCFLSRGGDSYRGLYTGGPCSQDLFNVYCEHWLDPKIRALGFGYTRYVDDLTLTSLEKFGRRRRHAVMQIIRDAGLTPNLLKTQGRDLRKGPVLVTGLVIHFDGRVGISKQYASRLSRLVYGAEKAIAAIERGELGLLPKGFMGSYGILKNVTRDRSMSDTEMELMSRYHQVRERIRALRGFRKKKRKKKEKIATVQPAAAT